jgi:hydroxymethylglutaryl-CoA lyase
MRYPARVKIVEVGPRDGLQNEPATVATSDKVTFIDLLTAAGCPVIEAGAFVSPKWIPQMSDTSDVFARISRKSGTRYPALVPNVTGLDRAREAGVTDVAIFAASSETFSRKNINKSIDESLDAYREVCQRARDLGMNVRAYLSTAFGCPYEGDVPSGVVARVANALIEMGAFEVAVSDTIGIAHPGQVPKVVSAVAACVPLEKIALHFHDTRGTALANVLVALDMGIVTFDASAGGLGGCPYAPGATGNLATEDLVYMLHGLGIATGIDLTALVSASSFIETRLGHSLPSRFYRAFRAQHA